MYQLPKHRRRLLWTGIAFLIAVIIYVVIQFVGTFIDTKIGKIIEHALLILSSALGLSLLERWFLFEETTREFRANVMEIIRSQTNLTKVAHGCGLTAMYKTREDAGPDIVDSIKTAQHRVWLLGVSLTREVSLDMLAKLLLEQKARGQDVKLLLMDPVCSPAVFRTVLESPPQEVSAILSGLDNGGAVATYTRAHLFSDVQRAANHLDREPEKATLGPCVKFYAHSAIAWMVITDDVLYYQPYSFGRFPAGDATDTIGPHMPVFRYEKDTSSYPFDIYCNHFEKLWCTSTTDLNEMTRRLDRHKELLKEIFARRGDWLKTACKVLSDKAKAASTSH